MMAHQTNFNLAPILLFMAWYIPGDSYWEFILVERGGFNPPPPDSREHHQSYIAHVPLGLFNDYI